MRFLLLSFLLCASYHLAWCQKIPKSDMQADVVQLAFKTDSSSVVTHYTYKQKLVKNEQATYHWVRLRETKSSVGGYSGYLQHGEFISYYLDGEIQQKGEFEYGLKHGTWKSWRTDGKFESRYAYKKGLRHGEYMQLSRDTIWTGKYVKGELHGIQTAELNREVVLTRKYTHGKLKVKAEKPAKPEKESTKEPKPEKERKEKLTRLKKDKEAAPETTDQKKAKREKKSSSLRKRNSQRQS